MEEDALEIVAIRRSRSTGRPVGAKDWRGAMEARTRRQLAPAKRGPKPRGPTTPDRTELFGGGSP